MDTQAAGAGEGWRIGVRQARGMASTDQPEPGAGPGGGPGAGPDGGPGAGPDGGPDGGPGGGPGGGGRWRRVARWVALIGLALVVALTLASFSYNLATNGQATRPAGLSMVNAGGFDTRYRSWGTTGSPIVLVPGAFETADTFAALGADLGRDHRVFAIDLTGTGYSQPSGPFTASHLADQLLAFLTAEHLTGPDAPVLVGHSSGAAVVGMAALGGRQGGEQPVASGVVFLDATLPRWASPPFSAGCWSIHTGPHCSGSGSARRGSSGRYTAPSAGRPARR